MLIHCVSDGVYFIKNYIIKSINRKEPILAAIWASTGDGHMVLIDNYKLDCAGNLEVQINWGWGNTKGENDVWKPTTGSITDPLFNYQWVDFILFKNTTPIT